MVDIIINKPNGYLLVFIFLDLCEISDIANSPCIIETLSPAGAVLPTGEVTHLT